MTKHDAIYKKADQIWGEGVVVSDHDIIADHTKHCESCLNLLDCDTVDSVEFPKNNVAHSETLDG